MTFEQMIKNEHAQPTNRLPFQGANLIGAILTQGDAIGLEIFRAFSPKNNDECPMSNIQSTPRSGSITWPSG
jgi:hypothetical protein